MSRTTATDASPLGRLRSEFDHLFERFFGGVEPLGFLDLGAVRRQPACNIWQDADHLHLEAELPGVAEQDIEVSVAGDELVIAGHREPAGIPADAAASRRERRMGPFRRVIHLPVAVDPGRVDATLEAGVLSVRLTKAARARTRRIPVRSTGE